MSRRFDRRPLLAALLSFLQPGLGHAYLREWFRALLWFVLWIGSFLFAVRTMGLELTGTEALAALFGLFVTADVPSGLALAMVSVSAFSGLDAYWAAAYAAAANEENGPRCPHCGREIDPTLEFCHWCTTQLEREPVD